MCGCRGGGGGGVSRDGGRSGGAERIAVMLNT